MKEKIYDFYGRIVGTVDTDANGNKVGYDFYGRVVGKYNKALNRTYDFYGRIIAQGDALTSLIYSSDNNK